VQQPPRPTTPPEETRASAPPAPAQTPRQALLATLTNALGAFVAAGDVEAALAVHETIGRLLGAPAAAAAPGTVAAHDDADPAARRSS